VDRERAEPVHVPAAGDQGLRATISGADHRRRLRSAVGLPLDYHYTVYWKLTQRIYAGELDPSYTGTEADYDYARRPEAHKAIRRIALTGRIGKPLVTIQGTYDSLLPITQDSDVYAAMARRTGLHTYLRVEAGNHVDGLVDAHPDQLVPLVPMLQRAIRTPS